MAKPKYAVEQKALVCKDYLSGKKSANRLAEELNLGKRGDNRIRLWATKYSAYEEPLKIVKDCLAHDRDIKSTALKYGCNYAQIYQWVRKYEAGGEKTLLDRRGKRK
ncbi:MAG TPA: helix-turn-helix domain-containing protein [Anaerovoracaceae bacterium]|nr:helix-turn-helix domain-containing protein [Anaerovoracaceae bacterium]